MTKPVGENELPATYYGPGRRKHDPKIIEFPAPRRFWERGPVVVGAALLIGLLLAAHFLSGCRLIGSNPKYGHFTEGR